MAVSDLVRQIFGGGNQQQQQAPLPSRPNPDMNVYDDPYAPAPTPAMDAFYEHSMNLPVRQGPSKLRMVGTGLLSALQGSTGQESRVPLYNAAGKVVGSREAGFWESLGNKPFDVDESRHILDMPHEAAIQDWKLQGGALQQAANIEKTAEANQALAEYRRAQATAAPQRAAAAQTTADARVMDAETKARVASLKDLSDSERLRLLQEGKVTLADINNAAALQRTQTQQAGATERTGMQQTGATERTGIQQAGATERTGMQQEGATTRTGMTVAGANERAQMGGAQIGTIPDPSDPTKQVGVWYNPRTQRMERVSLDGQNVGAVTKPGTPDKTGAGAGKETPQEIARLQNMRTRTSEALQVIDQIIDPATGKLTPQAAATVGKSRLLGGRFIPGTKSTAGEAAIDRLKNMITIDLIGEMKAQSRTGATGFGNMSNKDLGVLEKAASQLNPNLDEESFIKEVQRIQQKLKLVMEPQSSITTTVQPGAEKEQRRNNIINRYLPPR